MRTIPAIAASAALLIALAGCSVSVTDSAEPDETTPAESAASEPSQEATATQDDAAGPPEESDASAEAESGPSSWGEETADERDAALAAVSKTVSCSGELVLGDSAIGQVVEVDGACEHLALRVSGAVVVAGDVTALDVSGAGNVVYVDSVESISVSGDASVIHWLGATPAVKDTGAGNVTRAG